MTNPRVLLITTLLIASFSSLSHGLIINGLQIGTIRVNGLLFCSVDGNLIGNSPPLSGATVNLVCGGSTTSLGQAVTNPAGAFEVVVKIADTIIFDPSICNVNLRLPLATCSAFPPDGVLSASVSLVNVVQSGIQNIANYGIGNFVHSTL